MLRIHEDQMARLAQRQKQGYVARMADYLANSFSHWVGGRSRAELEAWVEAAVDQAERHGVRMEAPVAQWMLLLLVLGDDADQRLPWVGEILSDQVLNDFGKLRKLVAVARERAVDGLEEVTVVPEVCEP